MTHSLRIACTYGHSLPLGTFESTFVDGTLYGLVGPNGAGKSTLIKTLAGELEPLSGTVEVSVDTAVSVGMARSEAVELIDVGSRDAVGQVIHVAEPVFLPDLTVGEHLALMARAAHQPVAEWEDVAERWRLDELLNVAPKALSSGQRQRVFLATQLELSTAPVVLIDEPERHLDTDWQRFVAETLADIAGQGRIVVVATHSPAITERCDELIELEPVQ